jgi:hypothetical protein
MKNKSLKLDTGRLNILILVFGLALGAYARFLPTIMVGFPVTDGGLFHAMTEAIQAGHYSLPTFVEYNELRIDAAGGDKAEASGLCAAASVLVERSRTQERPRLALIWNLKGAQSW